MVSDDILYNSKRNSCKSYDYLRNQYLLLNKLNVPYFMCESSCSRCLFTNLELESRY